MEKNDIGIKVNPDENGYFGNFGGTYIPELLYPNIQELKDHYIEILESSSFKKEFKNLLKDYVGRPTPLYWAKNMSNKYQTHIYLKREDLCHTGAHKINNSVGQILLAKRLQKKRIIAETGAGQHGVATATVCALFGMECYVYMGETDMVRQASNVTRIKILGAKVVPVRSGNKTLKDAANEAMRDWINNPNDTHYIIGSIVGPHPFPDMIARLQSVIGQEIKQQLKNQLGREYPDVIVACVGGGSNAMGAFYPFIENTKTRLIGVEGEGLGVQTSKTAATMNIGTPGILHGSKTLLMQDANGQVLEPYSISAGLDYPGVGPVHAYLKAINRAEFWGATDEEALTASFELAKLEGIIPALETAHALAIFNKIQFSPEDIVVVNLSGRGDKDLETYQKWSKK